MKKTFAACKPGWLLLFCLATFWSGCGTFRDLKRESAEIEQTYGLAGKVALPAPPRGAVVVMLYAQKEGKYEIVECSIATDTGYFTFYVPNGAYYIAAFEDQNENFSHDPGEQAGYFGAMDAIILAPKEGSATDKKKFLNLDIHLKDADRFPPGFSAAVDAGKISRSNFVKIGQIASLDDKIFAQENGSTGYWKPLTFLRDFGVGVYFLAPYDPNKIPVLFIHGAAGSPEGWKKMVEQMDRKKFQPWFYYYPSGVRLDKTAFVLNEIIKRIHQEYRFKTLYVTAHSMGGLVARSFILKNIIDDKQDYIRTFVSISTPWNGHRLTAKGVEKAPAAIPSWHDMVPESHFIQKIFQNKFPDPLKYYLLFSYRGDCQLLLKNNDGTVELSSELDYRAQNDATQVYGFNEDHGSIIFSQTFIDRYNQILRINYSKK